MISTEDVFHHLAHLCNSASGWSRFNPNVAALIYDKSGKLVGTGVHKKNISDKHAEIIALDEAGPHALGGTMYVSLEPCAHTGATGPCTTAIIDSGITKVIFAVKDPNPTAQGGYEILKDAGIEVEYTPSLILEQAQRAWLHRMKFSRPLITVKLGVTLDGKISAQDGSSKWITSEDSRNDVQYVRSTVNAILSSTQTILDDNPSLLPRVPNPPMVARIGMGVREIPKTFNVWDGNSPFHHIASHNFDELIALSQREGFNHILVEAGKTLVSQLLRSDLVDEIIMYQAPKVLGSGKSWVDDLSRNTLQDALELELMHYSRCSDDVKLHYKVRRN